MSKRRGCTGVAVLLFGVMMANAALAQKQGGVLRVFHRDSPARDRKSTRLNSSHERLSRMPSSA